MVRRIKALFLLIAPMDRTVSAPASAAHTPEHYAVRFAAKHDYHGFYAKEIESRQELFFPPFINLIKITLRSRKEENVIKSAERLAKRLLQKIQETNIMGPAPSPMPKLRGYYRSIGEEETAPELLERLVKNGANLVIKAPDVRGHLYFGKKVILLNWLDTSARTLPPPLLT